MAERMPDFDGQTYVHGRDHARLGAEMARVRDAMTDGSWRTLGALAELTGDPEASISARLRDLRKPKFGGWIVDRRYAGGGLWEYRVSAAVPMAAQETAFGPGGSGATPEQPAAKPWVTADLIASESYAPPVPRDVPCPMPAEASDKQGKRCGRVVFLLQRTAIDPTYWDARCPKHGKVIVRVTS